MPSLKELGMEKKDSGIKIVTQNKKAYLKYEILETIECGLELKGSEVKSIRGGQVSISESYARPRGQEVYIYNMDISPYEKASVFQHKPKRPRKVLLHKNEIKRWIGRVTERGLTIVPLKVYFKRGWAKVELALARGRKLYDKREVIKERELKRRLRRHFKGE